MNAINVSMAAYPGMHHFEALDQATKVKPSEPLLGELSLEHTQLCPQNRGKLDEELATHIVESFPDVKFRLHANVHVQDRRIISDWANFEKDINYWKDLAKISQVLKAPGYSAHAGRRSGSSMESILEAARRGADLFETPVAIEGHYPTKDNEFLVSSWAEYQDLFESGVPYALDLSHLNIVAKRERKFETSLVSEMLSCERCLEVHVSDNNGRNDQHFTLEKPTWWWSLMDKIHPDSVIFSEGDQRSSTERRSPAPAL